MHAEGHRRVVAARRVSAGVVPLRFAVPRSWRLRLPVWSLAGPFPSRLPCRWRGPSWVPVGPCGVVSPPRPSPVPSRPVRPLAGPGLCPLCAAAPRCAASRSAPLGSQLRVPRPGRAAPRGSGPVGRPGWPKRSAENAPPLACMNGRAAQRNMPRPRSSCFPSFGCKVGGWVPRVKQPSIGFSWKGA